jgi:3-phenylpropionate/trans-cinnamate dioxygenase ferredoxin subunit
MTGQFIKACAFKEVFLGKGKVVKIGDREIVLIRDGDDIYALDNICTHDGGELGDGAVNDRQIECPRHGAKFDIKTGAATQMPAIVGVQTYTAKVENGDVFVAGAE